MNIVKSLILKFSKNQEKIREFIIVLLFKIRLLPKEYHGRAKTIINRIKYNKKFYKLKLKYNKMGYFQLEPMPSENFLNNYYEDTYWQSRWIDKTFPIKSRDLEHYKLLKKIYPNFDENSKNIVNLGSGPGGISILFHFAKHKVYNCDPSGTVDHFSERWFSIKDLNETKNKFDLIYSCMSLEHVPNINNVMKKFIDISHEKTIFFFEVPNCSNKKMQIIHPPHTYYFTKDFFINSFDSHDFYGTFNGLDKAHENEGRSIRFLSSSKIKNIF